MQTVTTIGLDIAKSVFQVHGVDGVGQVVIRRQLKRRYVLAFFQKPPPCLVGIEACASSRRSNTPRNAPPKMTASAIRDTAKEHEQWKAMPADRARCSYSYACPHRLYSFFACPGKFALPAGIGDVTTGIVAVVVADDEIET